MFNSVQSTLSGTVAIGLLAVNFASPTSEHMTFVAEDDATCCISRESTALPVWKSLTLPVHDQLDFQAAILGSAMEEVETVDALSSDKWADNVNRPAGWMEAEDQLAALHDLKDGWCGKGSVAANRVALMSAAALLRYLEQDIPLGPTPNVSLDLDGLPVLTWQQDGVFGSMSVFDDDTYSFYVERGKLNANEGDARLSDALPDHLLGVLRG